MSISFLTGSWIDKQVDKLPLRTSLPLLMINNNELIINNKKEEKIYSSQELQELLG